MNEENIIQVLRDIGMSRREAEIYLFLSKKGSQNASTVSTSLKMERVQTYRALKSLQVKGVIEATFETPTRFDAVSFDVLLNSLIKTKKNEAKELAARKEDLIIAWKALSSVASEYPIAKFRVLPDKKGIYTEIKRMFPEANQEVLEITTSIGVIQEDVDGVIDAIIDSARNNPSAEFRILANISKENQEIIADAITNISAQKLRVQWRHLDFASTGYPQLVIKDGEETILYVTARDRSPRLRQVETGLWIRSNLFASALREAFMEMWRSAVRAEDRLEALNTGRPVEETTVIKDAEEAQRKLEEALEKAETDVIAIVSSDAVNTINENRLLHGYSKRNLRIRIMAPIDLDNIQAAHELSEICEVRNVPMSYLLMMIIDDNHVFTFKTPPINQPSAKTMFYLEDVFYTTDKRYVERVAEMLNDIWKRGVDIREVISTPTTKAANVHVSSGTSASEIIDSMLTNNASSVLVTERNNPVGIITERDVLEKIVKPMRNPAQTSAKEIMSMPVLAIEPGKPLTEALRAMQKTNMPKLAVFKNGKLVAMLTRKSLSKT